MGCGLVSQTRGAAWVMRLPQLTSGLGVGGGQCTTASNLPAEPVAAFFRGLKHMLYKMGRGGREGRRLGPTIHSQHRLHWKTWRRTNPLTFCDLASGLVVFSQIKSFGHNDETTQQGAYLSLTQLQYKTVRKRQKRKKKQKKIVKRAFCVHAQQHTGGIAFLGFI